MTLGRNKQRLDLLLLSRGLASSRHQAAGLIMAGRVKVDGRLSTKSGQATAKTATIKITPGRRYVSRAALKLESVTSKLELDFKGKVVLDVGASTGGFSDFALQQGAKRIYAVDVGRDQLDDSIRQNPRVVAMERTDIRDVKTLAEPMDIALVDVSFISLKLILEGLISLLSKGGVIVAMVKPQFEADRATASMHKGVIKNDTIRRAIFKDFETWAKTRFQLLDKADSEVTGTKGNRERFYLLKPLSN